VSRLIAVGALAPPFVAEGSDGRRYVLRDVLAAGRVLLAFYPGNDTPG
jgi:peroxiredoxin